MAWQTTACTRGILTLILSLQFYHVFDFVLPWDGQETGHVSRSSWGAQAVQMEGVPAVGRWNTRWEPCGGSMDGEGGLEIGEVARVTVLNVTARFVIES